MKDFRLIYWYGQKQRDAVLELERAVTRINVKPSRIRQFFDNFGNPLHNGRLPTAEPTQNEPRAGSYIKV